MFDPAVGAWRNGSYRILRPRYFLAGGAAEKSPYGPVAIFAGGNDGGDLASVDFVPVTGL